MAFQLSRRRGGTTRPRASIESGARRTSEGKGAFQSARVPQRCPIAAAPGDAVVAVAIMVTAFIFPNALVEGQRRYREQAANDRVIRQTLVSAGQPNRALVMKHDSWTELSSRIDSSALSRANAAPGVARNARGQLLVTDEVVAQQIIGDQRGADLDAADPRGRRAQPRRAPRAERCPRFARRACTRWWRCP